MALAPLASPPEQSFATLYMVRDLAFEDVTRAYGKARGEFLDAMKQNGLDHSAAEEILEACERAFQPRYGSAGNRHPLGGAAAARHFLDQVRRNGVEEEVITRYETALLDYRGATATLDRAKQLTHAREGGQALNRASEEAQRLKRLREEVRDEIRRMNPDIELKTLDRLTGDEEEEEADYDPLRRTLAIALEPKTARREAYRQTFDSLIDALDERERKLILDRFADDETPPAARYAKAAEAFARWAAPQGRDKPPTWFADRFKPLVRLGGRIKGKFRGHGFNTIEDLYESARDGSLARRVQNRPDGAIAVRGAKDDDAAHARWRASIGKLSDLELDERLKAQDAAIREARVARRGLFRPRGGLESETRLKVFDNARGRGRNDEMRALLRGRAMLDAERRERGRKALAAASDRAGLEPPPTSPPGVTPPSPDRGPGSAPSGFFAANDDVAAYEGARGHYVAADRGSHHTLALNTAAGRQPLGVFANQSAMDAYVRAMESAPETGAVDRAARDLAARARRIEGAEGPPADIRAIRESGLLDPRLDEAITREDTYAHVFPLKGGSLLYRGADGGWHAGTAQDMRRDAGRDASGQLERDARAYERAAASIGPASAMAGTGQATPARADPNRVWLDVSPADEGRALAKGAEFDEIAGRYYAPASRAKALEEWRARDGTREGDTLAASHNRGRLEGTDPSRQGEASPRRPANAPAPARAGEVPRAGQAPAKTAEAKDARPFKDMPDDALKKRYQEVSSSHAQLHERIQGGQGSAKDVPLRKQLEQDLNAMRIEARRRGVDLAVARRNDQARKRARGAER